jgi:hypothetical protein
MVLRVCTFARECNTKTDVYIYILFFYIYLYKGKDMCICICMYSCMHAWMEDVCMDVWMYAYIYIWVQNPCLSLSVALLRGLWHFSIFCMVPHVGETWNVSNKTYVDARTILLSKGLDGPGCLQSTHRSAHSLWSGT